MKKCMLFIFLFLIFSGNTSCSSKPEQKTNIVSNGKYKLNVGDKIVYVEIVDTDEKRSKGLMFRNALPENDGMLFVFQDSQVLSFWMKNTLIPLDIAYISKDKKIIDILQMAPMDETSNYKSSAPVLYALEVNQGWFQKNGVKKGDSIAF